VLPAFLTTILFSISGVCAQRTSRVLGGVTANLYRVMLAAVLLALWAHVFGQGLSGKALPVFLLSGLLGFGLGDVALYQALPRLGSRLSILLVHCLAAPFAALVEWLWLGTTMTATQMLAALLILSGVALALAPGHHLQISREAFWKGAGFGVLAAFGQSMGAVLSRRAYAVAELAGENIDGLTAAYQRILAGVAVAFLVWLVVRHRREPTSVDPNERRRVWRWIVANALAGPAIGVGCYQWALQQHGTGVVLPIVALTPLVIIPFSRFIEGERSRKRSIAGGVIAAAGVFVMRGGMDLLKRWAE
jgi:drug/metabolite transporter (DMT)-like permease